jgi:hypothetical protein
LGSIKNDFRGVYSYDSKSKRVTIPNDIPLFIVKEFFFALYKEVLDIKKEKVKSIYAQVKIEYPECYSARGALIQGINELYWIYINEKNR